MDDLNKEKNKSKEDKTHTKELHQENKQSSKIIDTSIFDTTLKDIEQILNALEQKIHSGEKKNCTLGRKKSALGNSAIPLMSDISIFAKYFLTRFPKIEKFYFF